MKKERIKGDYVKKDLYDSSITVNTCIHPKNKNSK